MSKNICNFAERTKNKTLVCILNNKQCKFMRYCTQDSLWWCSNDYATCERRKTAMNKDKNDIEHKTNNSVFSNAYNNIIDKNVVKNKDAVSTPLKTEIKKEMIEEKKAETPKVETAIEIKKVEPKKNEPKKVEVKKTSTSRRRVLY